jgi:predicted enzyme related to lactoylglutathione lyase
MFVRMTEHADAARFSPRGAQNRVVDVQCGNAGAGIRRRNAGSDGDERFPPGGREHSRDRCPAAVADLGEQLGNRVQLPRGVGLPEKSREPLVGRKVEADQERTTRGGRWAVVGARRRGAFHAVEEAPLRLGADEAVETELAAEVVVERARGHPGRGREVGDIDRIESSLTELLERLDREPALGRRRNWNPFAHRWYSADTARRNQITEEDMKLEFLYTPTRDLQASLALYRDELGWEEAWREGESTVSLKLPGTDVQLMLDATDDGEGAFAPLFVLDDVRRFNAKRPDGLRMTSEPQEIPGGYLATFEDPSGNAIYVMDQSLDAAGSHAV